MSVISVQVPDMSSSAIDGFRRPVTTKVPVLIRRETHGVLLRWPTPHARALVAVEAIEDGHVVYGMTEVDTCHLSVDVSHALGYAWTCRYLHRAGVFDAAACRARMRTFCDGVTPSWKDVERTAIDLARTWRTHTLVGHLDVVPPPT